MIESEGLAAVNEQFELPLVAVLADIERAGVRVDTGALAVQSRRLEAQLAELSARIYAMAGMEFNVNSPKQLAEVLFDRLNLPALKKTGKTRSASTAVEVLEELAESHELPRLILDWRSLQKLKGTYIDALPMLVNPKTGRVHTSFNQAVAATGRLSSSDPNLQNIPIRSETGREIRRAFIAAPDHVLISADYSQIELRVLAHLAGDETLIEAFKSGEDIHDRTALKVFGPSPGLDPHELRRRAKIVNYALLYGKTAFTLARDIGVTKEAAQEFIDAYFAGFPRVRKFIDDTLEGRAAHRRRQDDVRPATAGAGSEQPQRPGAGRRRTRHREHAHTGHGRRHPEARDDRRARRAEGARRQRPDDSDRARRAAVRVPARRSRSGGGAGAGADGGRGDPGRAAHRRCRHRRELARRQGLTVDQGPWTDHGPWTDQEPSTKDQGP